MSESVKTIEEFYVLLDKCTGKPVHVGMLNADGNFKLTRSEDNPLYKAETLTQAWLTMRADVRWYNSDNKRPCWGDGLNNETLEIAKHRVVTELSVDKGPFKVPLMAGQKGLMDTRDVPPVLARRVFCKPDLDSERRYTIVLYNTTKEGATQREEFEKAIGSFVYFDEYSGRHLYAVATAREEYRDLAYKNRGDLELLCGLMRETLNES